MSVLRFLRFMIMVVTTVAFIFIVPMVNLFTKFYIDCNYDEFVYEV